MTFKDLQNQAGGGIVHAGAWGTRREVLGRQVKVYEEP